MGNSLYSKSLRFLFYLHKIKHGCFEPGISVIYYVTDISYHSTVFKIYYFAFTMWNTSTSAEK